MTPRTRRRLQLLGLLSALVVTAASAAAMLDTARLVEVVGLAAGAFGTGASVVSLVRRRIP